MDPTLLLFAFIAGAAAFFAPCCVAMLPAYIGYAIRPQKQDKDALGPVEDFIDPNVSALREHRVANTVAFFGIIPVLLGIVPLVLHGLRAVSATAAAWTLPGKDVSLGLLLLGAAVVTGGLVWAGKGEAAARGALFGTLGTLGFLVVFLTIGLPVAFLARSLAPWIPWLSIIVGVGLVVLGLFFLAGKSFYLRLPGFSGDVSTLRGFFLFGLGYGIAGLSCTFPVFLAVIGAGALSGGFASALAVFVAYALGKGFLLVSVTMLTVAGGTGMANRVKQLTPYIYRTSAVLMIVAGGYIAFYFGRYAPGLGG